MPRYFMFYRCLRWALLCAPIVLVGCATGPLYKDNAHAVPPVQPTLARLVIFRESHTVYALGAARIEINGTAVGNLDNSAFFFLDQAPGAVTISADSPTHFGWYKIPLTLEPGKEYYLEIAPRSSSALALVLTGYVGQGIESASQPKDKGGLWRIDLVDRGDAIPRLADLHDETVWKQ